MNQIYFSSDVYWVINNYIIWRIGDIDVVFDCSHSCLYIEGTYSNDHFDIIQLYITFMKLLKLVFYQKILHSCKYWENVVIHVHTIRGQKKWNASIFCIDLHDNLDFCLIPLRYEFSTDFNVVCVIFFRTWYGLTWYQLFNVWFSF